jgi:hypothetical protein
MASRPIVSPIAIAAAAPLAHDHAGVHELLQVVAGVLLRELELCRELANAHRRTGARQHVQDLQPVPVRDRAQEALKLNRIRVVERRAGEGVEQSSGIRRTRILCG